MISWLALGLLSAHQGQALEITVPTEPGLESVVIDWRGRRLDLVETGSEWLGIVGIDIDLGPGRFDLGIELEFEDGRTRTGHEQIDVAATEFPTTHLEVEPRYVELDPDDQARAARESREIAGIYSQITPGRFWNAPFASPLPGVGGGRNFGHRRVFNGQPRAPHSGVDLRATTGTPVHAANSGRVVLAKDLFFSGNAVFVDHGLGVYSVYLHLSEILVENGQMVERGEVVGLAGATGRVTGPHLHWGVRVLDARVDPFTLVGIGTD
jgi:murein DD-endopeptidase MepM/ murein hydrolase activator NlpD